MSNNFAILRELLSGNIPGTFTSNQLKAVHRLDPEEEEEKETGHQKCAVCYGSGLDRYGETCEKCGGQGKLTADGQWIDPDEEEQEDEVGDPEPANDIEGQDQQQPEAGGEMPEQMPDDNLELQDKAEAQESEDPDRAGVIREVPNAHLVYKRENEEGSYDELWIYNIGQDIKDELTIRRSILAGTDIPPKKTRSEDGSQRYDLETLGNAQLLKITGLPQ